jgi:hypothetical protein
MPELFGRSSFSKQGLTNAYQPSVRSGFYDCFEFWALPDARHPNRFPRHFARPVGPWHYTSDDVLNVTGDLNVGSTVCLTDRTLVVGFLRGG